MQCPKCENTKFPRSGFICTPQSFQQNSAFVKYIKLKTHTQSNLMEQNALIKHDKQKKKGERSLNYDLKTSTSFKQNYV